MLDRTDHKAVRLAFEEFARTGDTNVRNRLVKAHIGLAEFLARRFEHRGEPLEDLVQVASLALVKAVERFEPDRHLEFTTFATPTIIGELKRHFRDRSWMVRVPRSVQELYLQVSRAIEDLSLETGGSPSIADIAKRVGVPHDQVHEAMEAGGAQRLSSLDDSYDSEGELNSIGDLLGEVDSGLLAVEERAGLEPLLSKLPDKERVIIFLRFYEGLSQSEIAQRLDTSQMHVSRLLARSLQRLRDLGNHANRRAQSLDASDTQLTQTLLHHGSNLEDSRRP